MQIDTAKIAFSVKDIAELGLAGRSTIWSWIATGDLQAVKIGGRTLVLRDALETFLKTRPAARSQTNREVGR